jgi:hypothetical protein
MLVEEKKQKNKKYAATRKPPSLNLCDVSFFLLSFFLPLWTRPLILPLPLCIKQPRSKSCVFPFFHIDLPVSNA